MALQKVTYVDGVTIIGAKNLNDIQDELIRQGEQQTEDEESMEAALALKADKSTTYTKTEVDSALALKADKSDTYTKAQVDTSLALKADKSDTYTKSEVDASLELKADKTETYTKAQVDSIVEDAIEEAVKEAEYTNFEMKSVSGDLIHITDGAGLIPVKYLKIEIDAVQDLHGQANPYPAGDGGIQQWDEVWEAGAISVENGQDLSTAGRIRSKNYIPVIPNEQYYCSVGLGTTTVYMIYYDADKNFISGGSTTWGGSYGVKTIPSTAYFMRFYYVASTYSNNISVNYPSTDHAYHPWENICPIDGFTGANLIFKGANLLNLDELASYVATASGNRRYGVLFDKPATYEINAYTVPSENQNLNARVINADGTLGETVYNIITNKTITPVEITITDRQGLLVYNANNDDLATTRAMFEEVQVQVAIDVQPSDYRSYISRTYPVTWENEAGTVYGGTLDVTNGVLTVERELVTYNEDSEFTQNTADIIYAPIPDRFKVDQVPLSNMFTGMLKGASADLAPNQCRFNNNLTNINFKFSSNKTVDEWKQELAVNNLQMVYTLVNPIVYDITAVTDIETLLGVNNIWADTGAVEELIYRISRQ